MFFPLSFINTATELHHDDLQLQNEISKTRKCLEKYPNLYEAILKSMPRKLENAEKDLAKQKSTKDKDYKRL